MEPRPRRVARGAFPTAVLLLGPLVLAACGAPEGDVRARLSLAGALGGADTAGFARADSVRPFAFPGDHGAHPDFRNEWWYVTGNLRSADGRRFGYQLTFFRTALAPSEPGPGPVPGDRSRWRTRQAWMAHFTTTDVEAGRFHAAERFERGALGLAGARLDGDGFRVWTGGWELAGPDMVFPLRLRASTDSVTVELELAPAREPVLQGESGLSRKGGEPGEASYYYSVPRLTTRGVVRTPGGAFDVQGTSWLDREWSTAVLPRGVVGWDWFALQLDDGREVMVYALRREDGAASPHSAGVVVRGEPGTAVTRLGPGDFELGVLGRWTSPVDGTRYPARWRLRIPRSGLDLEVRPVLAGQELDLAFRYWEGAVDVRSWNGGNPGDARPVGWGYVELTGYGGGERPSR